MIFHLFFTFNGLLFGKAECFHPESKMIVILNHGLKLIKADAVVFIIVIFLKLPTSDFRCVVFLDDIQRFQITKNSAKELSKAFLVHFLPISVYFKDELSCLCIILM